jgi:FkbM family methyltransferase
MKQVNGVWLPDHEEHLYSYAGNGPPGEWTYQKNKLDLAMPWVKKRDIAVDVGGHCGIWARELCKLFRQVHSFEPVKDHRACYELNQRSDNWTLYPYALGEKDGRSGTQTKPGSSGDTWLVPGGSVEVKKLDWFDLTPDLLKIDTEGYELFVLKGGEATLRKSKPVVIVEQKPGHGARYELGDTDAVTWLESLGYKMRREIWGDYILTCDV